MRPPPIAIPERVLSIIEKRPPAIRDRLRSALHEPRACAFVESTRASAGPLRIGRLARLFGRAAAAPELPLTASKWGGVPYLEDRGDDVGGFLGQVSFSELYAAFEAVPEHWPEGVPRNGMLGVFAPPDGEAFETRWFPEPEAARAIDAPSDASIGRFEARMSFALAWTLRSIAWFDDLPKDDHELFEALNELEIAGYDQPARGPERHRLFGHVPDSLREHYGFEPAPGRSMDIDEYELVMRITYDNVADFGFGTNWIYVLIHRDDRVAGRLDRCVVTGANS